VYAGGILLKPFIRWRNLAATPRDRNAFPGGLLASTWPIVSLAFVIGAVGEAFGYLCGPWKAPERLTLYELGFDRSEP
jgi:hypothetical protein